MVLKTGDGKLVNNVQEFKYFDMMKYIIFLVQTF